ncbi:hypothetical protein QF002_002393 [Paraburkholderia youngii]
MTTGIGNSRIANTDQSAVGKIDSDREGRDISRPHQGSDAAGRGGKSPPWAWGNCRSEFDWMDVHLPSFTSEWF